MTVHRLFHNLAPPDNVIENYWFGRVLNFELTEESCIFNVGFGFPELSRRALRRFEHSCNSLFAEDAEQFQRAMGIVPVGLLLELDSKS